MGKHHPPPLPPEGSPARENSVCFPLHSGDRTARMVAPGDGIVREINKKVVDDPATINRDPYEEGWLFSLHSSLVQSMSRSHTAVALSTLTPVASLTNLS